MADAIDADRYRACLALMRQSDADSVTQCLLDQLSALPGARSARGFEIYHVRGEPVHVATPVAELVVRDLDTLVPVDSPAWIAAAAEVGGQTCVRALEPAEGAGLLAHVGVEEGRLRFVEIAGDERLAEHRRFIEDLIVYYASLRALYDRFARDPLTGLLNRQTFETRLAQVMASARVNITREQVPSAWLAIIDLDHFKRINDKYGHLYGDEVLIAFGQLMRQAFRYSDLLFRYGGEEFVVIFTGTETDGVRAALDRFRSRIAAHAFPGGPEVTCSIGYTRIDPDMLPCDIAERADRALYAAKRAGRNRVVASSDDAAKAPRKAIELS
ncbi:MAG: GGDEF domain-containing protein [Gammaproteobacteria bacterium]|nr:GGDEF domain-containing protein [Gammaproteobacteria bacterium]